MTLARMFAIEITFNTAPKAPNQVHESNKYNETNSPSESMYYNQWHDFKKGTA